MGAIVTEMAGGGAVAIFLIGQAMNVQLSGAEVVGWVVGLVGFVICSLIGLVTWFMRREFIDIKGTQGDHGTTLQHQNVKLATIERDLTGVIKWKEATQEEEIKDLKTRLAQRGSKGE